MQRRQSWLNAGRRELSFLVVTTCLSIGCGGADVSAEQLSAVSLVVSAMSSDPEVAAPGEPQGGFGVERAFVSVSAVSLEPCAEDAASVSLPGRGYELLAEPPPGELVTTAVTELCALRLDLDPITQNEADDVPEGATIFVSGQRADGTPFELASEASMSLLFEAEPGASFGEQPLLLGFDLSVWLADIDPEGKNASSLLSAGTKLSAALYVDENDDQLLDEDERTPVATLR